jgi:Arc/MetJ-type ribon-helix-helix transcriptional regulator
MTTKRLTLRDEDCQFLERALRSGRYATESEVISEAIAELRVREELREARLGEIRTQILVGLEQLEAGEGREWSVAAVEAKGRAIMDSRAAE